MIKAEKSQLKTTFICTGNQGKISEFKNALIHSRRVLGISDIEALTHARYKELPEDADHFLPNAFSKLFSAVRLIFSSYDENSGFLSNINEILVDDSGLCVPTLGFEPGVHSAYYAGSPRDDVKNNLKLMDKIRLSDRSFSDKNGVVDEKRLDAFFICFLLKMNFDGGNNFISEMNPKSAKFFEKMDVVEYEKQILNSIDFSLPSGNFFRKIPANIFCPESLDDVFIDIYCGFCVGQVSTKSQQLSDFGHGYDPLFYPKIHPRKSFASMPIEEKNKISHRALALKIFQAQEENKNPLNP